MHTLDTIVVIICAIIGGIILLIVPPLIYMEYKLKKANSTSTRLKELKQQKGRFYFNCDDKKVYSSLPDSFTVKDLYKYYTKSRCRTVLRFLKAYKFITMDSKNVYHKTEAGKTQYINCYPYWK